MPTIRNSELTAEQWREMTGKILEERRGMTLSDFSKLYETDIIKNRGDYIHTESRMTGKSQALETAQKMKELERSLRASASTMTDFSSAMTSAAAAMGKGLGSIDSSGIRGLSATSMIIDDPISEEQIVSDNTDVLASIKKADQLDINQLDISDRTLNCTGGMVAMYIKDKGFRRKAVKPCNLTFAEFYDGKKKGVICKMIPAYADDYTKGGFPGGVTHIEIPVSELTSLFHERHVLKVLSAMATYAEGEAPKPFSGLYSEESIAGLPDFGAF